MRALFRGGIMGGFIFTGVLMAHDSILFLVPLIMCFCGTLIEQAIADGDGREDD